VATKSKDSTVVALEIAGWATEPAQNHEIRNGAGAMQNLEGAG
jgi:hypothetical protein